MDITVETPQNVEQVELVEEMPGPLAKKRKKNERAWKKTVAKVARHRPKGFPQMPSCKHSAKSKYRCAELSLQDVRKIHQQYYKDADLQSKKNFILQHVIVFLSKKDSSSRRLVFSENFNIGFDAPYTDKCSTCTRLECELATEKDAGKRETLKLNLKAHKVRADKFYKLLQENNDKELILS
ncbi:uncharacterized protein LOC124355966 [Homalodisca vitripennis]|uniref:uncharacterized protein LOC124355966 n=1 Tax=Homalodisca vitripennis TaxID=197043 RepID=UPI001EEB0D04|nr:uncharacterized protein LOC124355966 [Homalodisca vitripennis]